MQTNKPINVDDLPIIIRFYQSQNIKKAYRVTYRSKSGNEDFVGAKDKNEADKKVKEIEDGGHKIINVELLKARVYIKYPADAPKNVDVHRGPEGGLYYETEEILDRRERAKIEGKYPPKINITNIPKIKVMSVENALGKNEIQEFKNATSGMFGKDRGNHDANEFIWSLDTYGKIVSGDANEFEIQDLFDLIKDRLPIVYKFYNYYADRFKQDGNAESSQQHREIADDIIKLQQEFSKVKNQHDKIIAIDNFMGTAHTSAGSIIGKLWESLSTWHHPGDISDRYLSYLRHNIGKMYIHKAKVYIKNPQDAPQGAKIGRGERGGLYYESSQSLPVKPFIQEEPSKYSKVVRDSMQTIPRTLISKLHDVSNLISQGKTSKNVNIDSQGNYTDERIEIHNKVISQFIGRNSISDNKVAILMGGPTASGKSTLLKNKNFDFNQFVNINNDSIKEKLPGYNGINAELYHDEARDIAGSLLRIALSENRNIIIDGTMRNFENEVLKIKRLKEAGYKVKIISIVVDPKVTIQRATNRFIREKRFVPLSHIAETASDINDVQRKYKDYADEYELYDSTTFPIKRLI